MAKRLLFAALLLSTAAAADPTDLYLPASETGGSALLFDPRSLRLRAWLKRPPFRAGDVLDARALAEDLDFLRRAMRQEYAGYPDLLQRPGFDVEGFFDQRIAALRTGPTKVTYGDGVLALLFALREQIVDRHLSVPATASIFDADPRFAFVEYQVVPTDPLPPLDSCHGAARLATLRIAKQVKHEGSIETIATVSAHPAGETLTLRCGDRDLVLHRRVSKASVLPDTLPAYEFRRVGDVGIVTIRKLSGDAGALALLQKIAADYPLHRQAKRLVFDLRGNGGGSDGFVYDWIARAKRGAWRSGVQVQTPGGFWPWSKWNALVLEQVAGGTVDDPGAIAEREAWRRKWPRAPSEVSPLYRDGVRSDEARDPFPGAIVALVDRATGSSGESSAEALRAALGATIVGERSAGFLEYGNQRVLFLPRTGVAFRFGTQRSYYPTPVEGVGLPVDLYLSPEDLAAPIEQLLPLLKRLPR